MNKSIMIIGTESPTLAFARQELGQFLGDDAPAAVEIGVDGAMKADAFAVEVLKTTGGLAVRLTGSDASNALAAAYTFLERLGYVFDITGPVAPQRLAWELLAPGREVVQPAVRRRGIRQHINFPMDISGYPLDEAFEYLRNLARLRFNHITFHSYTDQWFEVNLPDRQVLAGAFFYNWRHDLPEGNEFLAKHVRNRKTFCIPAIEPVFDQPQERSRQAMAWLRAVIQESKRVGLYVQFSFEPRTFPKVPDALAACDAIVAAYPQIDRLELITGETGGFGKEDDADKVRAVMRTHFGDAVADGPELAQCLRECRRELARYMGDLGHGIMVLAQLKQHWAGRRMPALSCGIYCGVPAFLRLSIPLMRRHLAPDIEFAIMAGHGSRGVAHNLREAGLTDEDWARTLIYSWIEFDGLMFLQQNAVRGIRQAMEDTDAVTGLGRIRGMAFNHWRTAENLTCARYAAQATLHGLTAEMPFYVERARKLGIGEPRLYAAAMMEIDDADGRATLDLPNVGFCAGWGGDNVDGDGAMRWQLFDNVQRVEEQYANAQLLLRACAAATVAPGGRAKLALLDNRLWATILFLRAVKKGTELSPRIGGRDPHAMSGLERDALGAICSEAIRLLEQCEATLADGIADRGGEGLLISLHHNTLAFFRRVRRKYTGIAETVPCPQPGTVDQPPLPIQA